MSWITKTFNEMTIEQKVGQLIISRGCYEATTMKMLQEGTLGGIGSFFIKGICDMNDKSIIKLTNRILQESLIPPFFYTDCENGLPHMFPFGTEFPNQMAIAATYEPKLAYKVGKAIAKEVKYLGYDMIAGPILDINSNSRNPIIATRAFSDLREIVVEFGKEYVAGVQEELVLACGKHFPGHGDTDVDSHIAIPIIIKCMKTLRKKEFYPFKQLVKNGMKAIIVSPLYFPDFQPEERIPATFSEKVIKNMLKNSWKFNGLVITDSLSMAAITENYSVEEAAVLAIKAGNDMLLQEHTSNPLITHNALLNAVKSGVITEEEINEKVLKILKAKEWCKINRNRILCENKIEKLNKNKFHLMLSQEIADKSITVLENKSMPITDEFEILIISIRNNEGTKNIKKFGNSISLKSMVLYEFVKEYNENTAITTISENPSEEETVKILELSKKFKHIIMANDIKIISQKPSSGVVPESQIEFIKQLAKQNKEVSMLILGNPYIIDKLPKTSNIIISYSDCNQSIKATVDILFGKKPSRGRLPIKINRKYDRGYGLIQN